MNTGPVNDLRLEGRSESKPLCKLYIITAKKMSEKLETENVAESSVGTRKESGTVKVVEDGKRRIVKVAKYSDHNVVLNVANEYEFGQVAVEDSSFAECTQTLRNTQPTFVGV